jgi:hypothetical protein
MVPAGTPDRNGDGMVTLTDYLLGITTGPNRYENGPVTDTVGTHIINGTGACTTSAICVVNVNAQNNSTAATSPIGRAFSEVNNANFRANFDEVGTAQQEQVAPIGNSKYYGAVFELRNRYRKFGYGFGGSMRIAYTLSKLMDDGIVNTSDPTTPGDFRGDYSRSLIDRRHRIAVTATIDMPKWFGKLRISPLFRYGSSAPFNISIGGNDRNLDDVSNDRPNFNGNLDDINWRVFASPFPQELANQFTLAPIGSPGNLPRNAGQGPALYQFNLNVSREFKFGDRYKLRPTAEFTNILNWNVFSFGSNFIDFLNLNSTNPVTRQNARDGFLAPTRTVIGRRLRFGIRFDF